jgi:hypothetical protein
VAELRRNTPPPGTGPRPGQPVPAAEPRPGQPALAAEPRPSTPASAAKPAETGPGVGPPKPGETESRLAEPAPARAPRETEPRTGQPVPAAQARPDKPAAPAPPGQPAPKPFSVWEPAPKPSQESGRASGRDSHHDGDYQPGHAEPPAADTQAKLEQLKDLYLTAEAIGEDALVKHFDELSQMQRSLIREFFEKAGLGPSSSKTKLHGGDSTEDGASLPG